MHHRGEDCMNQLSSGLLKIGERIANEEKEDMSPLANDEKNKHKESMNWHICNRPFNTDKEKVNITKSLRKLKIIAIIQENTEALHILYVI